MTSVSSKTAPFLKYSDEYARIRAISEGAKGVKNATYIRSPKTWEDEEKRAFEADACFFNATKRTMDGFSGMVTIKPATIDLPSAFDDLKADVDGIGSSVDSIINKLADELCGVGNIGVLVDYPESAGVVTIAQAQAQGLRPSLSFYAIESILEVKHTKIGNNYVLTRVRLAEKYIEPVVNDEFAETEKDQVRVLDISEGSYRVRVFRGKEVFSEVFPRANGALMREIPFRLITATGDVTKPCRPPLDDLAETNIDHLNNSAWVERAARFAGSPMFAIFGMNKPQEAVRPGDGVILWCPDPSGKLQVESASADSAGMLSELKADKRADMAVIGARFLQADTSGNIAENTAVIHRSGDNATLSTISASIEQGITEAFRFCGQFKGVDASAIKITLTRDYLPTKMIPQELTALVSALQSGAITKADLYDNLVRGEIIQPREDGSIQFIDELANEGFVDTPINPQDNNAPVQ